MAQLDDDVTSLEAAMRDFFHAMKRPTQWERVQAETGIALDRPAGVVLQVLAAKTDACHVQDLAQQLGIEPPSITRKTQELEQAGYLRRVRDQSDKRAVRLELTPQGQAAAQRISEAKRQVLAGVMRDWPAADRATFVSLFQRFNSDIHHD